VRGLPFSVGILDLTVNLKSLRREDSPLSLGFLELTINQESLG
jgi:hypothetical protein